MLHNDHVFIPSSFPDAINGATIKKKITPRYNYGENILVDASIKVKKPNTNVYDQMFIYYIVAMIVRT